MRRCVTKHVFKVGFGAKYVRWEQKSQPVVFDIYRRSNILRSHMEAGDVKLGHCLLQLHLHHIQGHDGGQQLTRATNTLLIQTLHVIGVYV